jgi:hypothetical protein
MQSCGEQSRHRGPSQVGATDQWHEAAQAQEQEPRREIRQQGKLAHAICPVAVPIHYPQFCCRPRRLLQRAAVRVSLHLTITALPRSPSLRTQCTVFPCWERVKQYVLLSSHARQRWQSFSPATHHRPVSSAEPV